jgi:rRNA processing protein Krr1/Pno1
MSSRDKSKRDDSSERRRRRERSREKEREGYNKSPPREKREKRSSKWSDAPSGMSTRFSAAPETNNEKSNNFSSKPLGNDKLGLNPNIYSTITDNSKIKKKIYIPKVPGINYVGLLIGPKGTYQKRLEQQSGCKILVRGKGTQKEGMPPQPDDHEEQHVLIVAETEDHVKRAQHLIERILFADEHTRNKIKEEQIKASQEIRTEMLLRDGMPNVDRSTVESSSKPLIEEHLMTPYGPPDKNARIMPVPNDCVGLIIGKNGETIRRLNRESGCKIQIAVKPIPYTESRNVFVEGPPEKYEIAKKLIEEIISEQIAMKQNFSHLGEVNPFPGPHTPLRIPNKMVGLIIGRNGETVKIIHQKTGCFIFIPKESRPGEDFRELQLSGPPDSVEICKREIISMIHLALYGRLPYMNSLFYPFIDPITGLPIIDPGILAQLDPNTKATSGLMSNYDNFEQSMFENSKNQEKVSYDMDDYNNPLNYDLYYQSLYQMYPQMNDYYKKAVNQNEQTNNNNTPFILFNTSILDPNQQENNTMYDPNSYFSMYNNQDGNFNGPFEEERKSNTLQGGNEDNKTHA